MNAIDLYVGILILNLASSLKIRLECFICRESDFQIRQAHLSPIKSRQCLSR